MDEATCQAFDALAAELWHRLPGAPPGTDDVLLSTRGFDLGLSERCPALDTEQRCSLHERGKPAVCRVVPLDALSPDCAQHGVLASREAQAHGFGSDCIAPGLRPGFTVLTRRLRVVDASAERAVAERRKDLAAERRLWGDAVFELLEPELFASPAALERVPARGFMTLSLTPVLLVLSRRSAALRRRCCHYLEAQGELAERLLREADPRHLAERESVRQLERLARANARLFLQLKAD